ncbi:MAG: exopolyphosphatase [Oscillospiraceae bacterium]|nr:exopolyphosphatase [Oscillospiraceae bacterium]
MRLLTRSDFDGLVCGALLKHLGIIESWHFVHPKDMQDGIVSVTQNDVLANVPFVPGCGMWFDHHATEIERMGKNNAAPGECRLAPSAARVIYEYYNGLEKMPHFQNLVLACDKVDSGQLEADEIQNPKGGVLLGFIMDPRTGLGRFRNFRISNLELMARLLDCCSTMSVDEILEMPDVQERVALYWEQDAKFKQMLSEYTTVDHNVIITDLRQVSPIWAGNRFMLYSLHMEQNVSVWVVDGRAGLNVAIAIGHSVLNRTCKAHIGQLCFSYGGGGHRQVGTCQVDIDRADEVLGQIVAALKAADMAF